MKSFPSFEILILLAAINFACQNSNNNNKENSLRNDSLNIKTMNVSYLSGNDTVRGYLAMPEGEGPFPALIVIHEWWGLNDRIKDDADSFADNGYAALAVDLYNGKTASNPKEASQLAGSVSPNKAVPNLIDAFNYIKNLPEVDSERIGSIGWCFGGGYSLQAALNIPGLSACIVAYGRLAESPDEIKKISCPVLGIFAEKDPNITPAKVKNFEKILNDEGKENKIIIYPNVSHAFMNPDNKNVYDDSTANKAWDEIYSFLDKNLGE
jgi:carboxymethylenebutenolidase